MMEKNPESQAEERETHAQAIERLVRLSEHLCERINRGRRVVELWQDMLMLSGDVRQDVSKVLESIEALLLVREVLAPLKFDEGVLEPIFDQVQHAFLKLGERLRGE